MILADHAEVISHKLYLMGGGWDSLTVNSGFPTVHSCALAISFRVPWNETNHRQEVLIEIVDEDGGDPLLRFGGQIEVGRPAGIRPGHTQRFQMALNVALEVPKPGVYEVIAQVEGQKLGSTTFSVVAGPNVARSVPPSGPHQS